MREMELTRRDALVALGAAGVAAGTGATVLDRAPWDSGEPPLSGEDVDTLVAVAAVVYPSAVSGVRTFVETYSVGRVEGRTEYREGMADALATLDSYATDWEDAEFAALDVDARDGLLHDMAVHTAPPDPAGTDAERVRHFLVDELLYALYTSPTGGRLVGIENPPGHPGGIESYQRREGPDA